VPSPTSIPLPVALMGQDLSFMHPKATDDIDSDSSFSQDRFEIKKADFLSSRAMQAPFQSPQVALTTLMIRNIPVTYTQDMLLNDWPSPGGSVYDFLYLPYNFYSQRNLGYAFINFVSEELAMDFHRRWHRKRLSAYSSSCKPLNIGIADVQWFEGNVRQLKKKRLNRIKFKECQPILFTNGRRVSLSKALHKIEMAEAVSGAHGERHEISVSAPGDKQELLLPRRRPFQSA